MPINKKIEVICDECQKHCLHDFIRVSFDNIPSKNGATYALGHFPDLIFCDWKCIDNKITRFNKKEIENAD